MFNHVAKEIGLARGIDGLLPLLGWLCRETERIISADRMRADDMHQITENLEQLRALLDEAARLISRMSGEGASALLVWELAARYRDLEGKAKEIRNDLQRTATRG